VTFADGGIQDTLRRRFSNALQWYYSLVNATEVHIQTSLENARSFLEDSTEPDGLGGSPMDEGLLLFLVATSGCYNEDVLQILHHHHTHYIHHHCLHCPCLCSGLNLP
jgi:hypothetical protein